MAYDLEEQEQLEGLKAFWHQYGNFILTVLIVVFGAIAAYRGWGWYQSRQAAEAAAAYDQLRTAVIAKDMARIKEYAGVIFESHGRSAYGQMAAMVAAKAYAEAGDFKAAKAPLQWASEKALDEEFRHTARLRLAGILLDEKAFDDALKLVATDPAGQFAGLYADRRGDILVAQAKPADAAAAYKVALEKLDARSPLRRLVQVKLDALGAGS